MAEVLEGVGRDSGGVEHAVAIKRLRADRIGDAALTRAFIDEARIGARLDHPNLVRVLDFGQSDEGPFQVLELVDGVDALRLQQRSERTLPIELALYITAQVAGGLEHAHAAVDREGGAAGVVHRDVKPGNILLSWSGDVKLSDFGIARAADLPGQVAAEQVKGTITYMAPEQALDTDVDCRADIFALGCVLHALVSGATPVSGLPGLQGVISGREVPLDTSLPEDVRAIIARALRPVPSERYASAAQMGDALMVAIGSRLDGDPRAALAAFLAPDRRDPDPAHAALEPYDLERIGSDGDVPQFSTVRAPPAPPVVGLEGKREYAGLIAAAALLFGAGALATALIWRSQNLPSSTQQHTPSAQRRGVPAK